MRHRGRAPCAAALLVLAAPAHADMELGGDLRIRWQDYRPSHFGIGDGDDDRIALYRGLLHFDAAPRDGLRVFVELGAHAQHGRNGGASRTDRSALDVQQGFAEFGHAGNALRVGRQEFTLGSSRLVSLRDAPNIRLVFDGMRATHERGPLRVDAFALRPVRNRFGAFDDGSDDSLALWGVNARHQRPSATRGFEGYWLGYERKQAAFAHDRADERRQSAGARLYGHAGAWDWNTEVVGQQGRFGADRIRAWTLATDTGYSFAQARYTPRLGVKLDIASGDDKPGDGRLGTFNALYPNAGYFSAAALLAPANLMDVQPTLTFHPTPGTEVVIGWDFAWKHRRDDAVYTTPTPLSPVMGTAGGARRIGDQVRMEAEHVMRPGWTLQLHLVRFNAGPAVRQAGGRDVFYTALTSAWEW